MIFFVVVLSFVSPDPYSYRGYRSDLTRPYLRFEKAENKIGEDGKIMVKHER